MRRIVDDAVTITGIGLYSAVGEGVAAHARSASQGFRPAPDRDMYPPLEILPGAELSVERHIPRAGDRRQMEPWQHAGVYVAGVAVEMAGFADLPSRSVIDVFAVANGGGREDKADDLIFSEAAAVGPSLNAAMMKRMRPSFFLTQLPNMLASNIAVVLGVGGASRTYMGAEDAGATAFQSACTQLATGRGSAVLLVTSVDATSPDRALDFALEGHGVHTRAFGTQAAALLLERESVARSRGASPLAKIAKAKDAGQRLVSSANTCPPRPTTEPDLCSTDILGHGCEAQFITQLGLAGAMLASGRSDAVDVVLGGPSGETARACLERPT